ncbi:hypothetical protein AURDEDRAFT_112771 [Auricularia subglabra TFB-10046 SS5]|nr:hypothetical protein AURDEDRAFT_112771 [Auricularia subglabra TFB-10046 SS5]
MTARPADKNKGRGRPEVSSDDEMDLESALSDDVWSGSLEAGSGVSVPAQQLAYLEQGYLPAPQPMEELARLRALYQHNILNTSPDMNFERLVNLVKLVFQTKVVTISLVDANKEWFKSELGMHVPSVVREESFCAHAILQKHGEPLVVLNAAEDWRFANNPLVTDSPGLRFYVAAQLRTQDGFNIGALTIADDEPRTEFGPRQRHTLTEFAGVVMREIVMWRDKIRLRVRDRIQSSMEQMTRECLETPGQPQEDDAKVTGTERKMAMIFDYSAKLIKRTLEVEGVMVLDVVNADIEYMKPPQEAGPVNSLSLISYSAELNVPADTKNVSIEDYAKIREYLLKHAHGRMVDDRVPAVLRGLIPSDIKYGLLVPLIDVDKRLFALLCAYNTTHRVQPFDGHELSYLRAIGVIILCAMLQQRMVQADRTKTLFISNISHELRTPLHGIVAATELLMDSPMDQHQTAILRTIQACGNILTETVNHVLDFSKHAKASEPEHVDLVQLTEMAVEGCWLGFRARTSSTGGTDIQRVYSSADRPQARTSPHVETVIDIDYRDEGWEIKCDKSGIQRVIINLVGNSLKFTTDGNVHIALRELHGVPTEPDRIRVELKVSDTGKGISKEFLKNQLFHPFSQENPMQQGTGLGLAIVKNIVRSKNVNGTVDVWSTEGVGTGIRIVMDVEVVPRQGTCLETNLCAQGEEGKSYSVQFVGFSPALKGEALLRSILEKYVSQWWGFSVADNDNDGDILLINEDMHVLQNLVDRRLVSQAVVFMTSFRKDPVLVAAVTAYEQLGGYCRVIYKPTGPRQLFHALEGAVPALMNPRSPQEPLSPRSPTSLGSPRTAGSQRSGTAGRLLIVGPPQGTAKAVAGPSTPDKQLAASEPSMRVLIMEDNTILRNLLVRWATLRNYYCQAADDGEQGVELFESSPAGTFDVVLLDVTMPRMDGIDATKAIRGIETRRAGDSPSDALASRKATIVALTGMSSEQDKDRAYKAGVNQYLVKPVSFKTLDDTLHALLKMAKTSQTAAEAAPSS